MRRSLVVLIALWGLLILTACNRGDAETPPPAGSSPTPEPAAPAYPEPTASPVREVPATAVLRPSPGSIPSTATPTRPPAPTPTPAPPTIPAPTPIPYVYGVPPAFPARSANFAHPDLGCNWMGVAGRVLDEDGRPVNNLIVELGGSIAGNPVAGLTITGDLQAYGAGSYEIQLGAQPLASVGTVWVRLYDLAGRPLSAPAYFNTSRACTENLIVLDFVPLSTLPGNPVYLPLVEKGR